MGFTVIFLHMCIITLFFPYPLTTALSTAFLSFAHPLPPIRQFFLLSYVPYVLLPLLVPQIILPLAPLPHP